MQNTHYIDFNLVRRLMEEGNIDISSMSEKTGISKKTIKKYLAGADQSHISALYLFKFAQALNVSSDTLIHKDYSKN